MKKILFFILSITIFTNCSLEMLPETELSDAGFWKSEKELRGACNRLYENSLLDGFSHDRRSDELVATGADGISNGSRSIPATSDDWKKPYDRIYVSNNIIDKSANTGLQENIRNRWIAEAHFFRAYNYFILVKRYGGVPLILKSFDDPNDPEAFKGRNTLEEVIAQCYADLEFAAQYLPTRASLPEADWGRVTRSAALAMTARIGLYIGTLTKYHNLSGSDSKAHLKKSIDAFELLAKEGHNLYPDFQKLFTMDGEGSANKENIFVRIYGPNGAPTVYHGNSRGMENAVSLTRQMVDQFLYIDGLPREKSALKPAVETSFNSALEKRDPRLTMTVFSLDEEAFKGPYQPFANQHGNGYSLKKGFMIDQWNTTNREYVDKMLIRYGEMLVTYAEALYEYNNTITDAQLDATVNLLRARAGFKNATNVVVKLTNDFVTSNGLNMLDEIRRERTVELIDEGFRYDDIIRWKIAEKVLPVDMIGAKLVDSEVQSGKRENLKTRLTDANGKLNGKQVYDQPDMYVIELAESRKFDPAKDYLYPIPVNEIALTNNAITQNPGWDK